MKKLGLLALTAGLLSLPVQATDKMYGVVGSGYGDAEYGNGDVGSANLFMGLGHQFAPKWYVEGGYKRLFDETEDNTNLKADSLYLAILGKAANQYGELYYKLGVVSADISGKQVVTTEGCAAGEQSGVFCEYDDGVFGGLVGLGFDMNIARNSMLRFEYEYIGGEDDLSVSQFNIGFRYNFN